MAVGASLDAARWSALCERLGLPPSPDTFARLQTLHAQRHRHYHTAAHINAMLGHLDRLRSHAKRPDLIELAIWFHDAVYKPMSQTNERDSADMAVAFLSGHLPPDDVETVETMIVLTQTHGDTTDPDTALMLDIDLSILAAPPEAYQRYTEAIRREYRLVPGPLYRRGRAKVLRHFLDMPRIYKTDAVADAWESAARGNLVTELESM